MKKEFEFIYPISKTKDWAGYFRIEGEYGMSNGEIFVNVHTVNHSYSTQPDTDTELFIPAAVIDCLDNRGIIQEAAYEHCKSLMPIPDISHIVQTKGGLS